MSIDLHLYDGEEEIISLNWLRNPFGLCNWAEDNVGDNLRLHYVCNEWTYGKSDQVNRPLFKQVVEEYWARIQKLDAGYFFFDLSSYRQFVEPHIAAFPGKRLFDIWSIDGSKYDQRGRLMIPMGHFDRPEFDVFKPSLEGYREWFSELVRFAEKLQNEKHRFYASN